MPDGFLDKILDAADDMVGVLEGADNLARDRSAESDRRNNIIDAEYEEHTPADNEVHVPADVRPSEHRIMQLRVEMYNAVATMRLPEERKQLLKLVQEIQTILNS